MTTKPSSSSTISVTMLNSRCTSLPLSENHLEKSECELISTSLPCVYLQRAVRQGSSVWRATHAPLGQADCQLLRQRATQRCLAGARRAVQQHQSSSEIGQRRTACMCSSAHLFHATTLRSTFASEKRSVVAM